MRHRVIHPPQILRRHAQVQPGFPMLRRQLCRDTQKAVAFGAVPHLQPDGAQLVMCLGVLRHPRKHLRIGGGGFGQPSGGKMGGGGIAQMAGGAHACGP